MFVRQDAQFRQILREARNFDIIQVERKGSAQAHPSVKRFIQFNANFGVDDIAMFHRNVTATIEKAYHKGWIPHYKRQLNDMQTTTNLYFSSEMGADAIRAMEHMNRVLNMIKRMKA
jgi:hypothetical protein